MGRLPCSETFFLIGVGYHGPVNKKKLTFLEINEHFLLNSIYFFFFSAW